MHLTLSAFTVYLVKAGWEDHITYPAIFTATDFTQNECTIFPTIISLSFAVCCALVTSILHFLNFHQHWDCSFSFFFTSCLDHLFLPVWCHFYRSQSGKYHVLQCSKDLFKTHPDLSCLALSIFTLTNTLKLHNRSYFSQVQSITTFILSTGIFFISSLSSNERTDNTPSWTFPYSFSAGTIFLWLSTYLITGGSSIAFVWGATD